MWKPMESLLEVLDSLLAAHRSNKMPFVTGDVGNADGIGKVSDCREAKGGESRNNGEGGRWLLENLSRVERKWRPFCADLLFSVGQLHLRIQCFVFRTFSSPKLHLCVVTCQTSGFRIKGSGFRVQGSGFRVQGSEKTPSPQYIPNANTNSHERCQPANSP
jgi:hypothetical protein